MTAARRGSADGAHHFHTVGRVPRELARSARKLREDLAAVQAGLTLRHSNAQTEGHVNRLKLVKLF